MFYDKINFSFLQFESHKLCFQFSNILCLDKQNKKFFFFKLASLIIVCTLPSQFSPVIVPAVEN